MAFHVAVELVQILNVVAVTSAPDARWKWSPLATVDPDPPVAAAIALVQLVMDVAADGVPWEWSSPAVEYLEPRLLAVPNATPSITEAEKLMPLFLAGIKVSPPLSQRRMY